MGRSKAPSSQFYSEWWQFGAPFRIKLRTPILLIYLYNSQPPSPWVEGFPAPWKTRLVCMNFLLNEEPTWLPPKIQRCAQLEVSAVGSWLSPSNSVGFSALV